MNISPFQKKVYDACSLIPKGKVSTYKLLSDYLKSHPRAIGQALKRNPYAPEIPCHRVIASDFSLYGYKGKTSGNDLKLKENLLRNEGVLFHNGLLIEKNKVFHFIERTL